MNDKQDILNILQIIYDDRQAKDTDPFRANVYSTAIDQIKKQPDKSLQNIQFKSDSVKEIVDKYLQGQSVKVILQSKNVNTSLDFESYNQFLKIPGIGPKNAYWLIMKKNIHTLNQLKKNKHILTEAQKLGLKYFDDLQKKIPREEMHLHKKKLENVIQRKFTIAGSYRRNFQESGDIDVLIRLTKEETDKRKDENAKSKTTTDTIYEYSGKILKNIVENENMKNYLLGNFMYGQVKYAGICKLEKNYPARHIDFLITDYYQYPFALLYFTGNAQFNEYMRSYARTLGYSLNQEGIQTIKDGEYISGFTSEKDIFHFLNLPYIEPKKRNYYTLQYYINRTNMSFSKK